MNKNSAFTQEEKEVIINALNYLEVDKDKIDSFAKELDSEEITERMVEELSKILDDKKKLLAQEKKVEDKTFDDELEKIREEEGLLEKDFDKYYDETFGTEAEYGRLDDLENDEVIKKIDQIYGVVINKLNEYRDAKTDEEITNIKNKLNSI